MLKRILLALFFGLCTLAGASLATGAGLEVPIIDGPCELHFPEDHGPHPAHRIEWWYYTGNLSTEAGRPFGFELTFFRSRLAGTSGERGPERPSAWRTDQVWAAHFAISDIQPEDFHQSERVMRGAMGLAGAERQGASWQLNVRDWTMAIGPDGHTLRAQTEDMGLELELRPAKGPVLHGRSGYSQKGSKPTSASCYVSFPRLQGSGRLRLAQAEFHVSGSAWMDHEFSSSLLEKGLEGWDWFSLQLDDFSEIMVFILRTGRGKAHPASAGTFISPEGKTHQISSDEVSITVLDTWQSPKTGIVYPSGWRLTISSLGLEVVIRPRMNNQEMLTRSSSGRIYWEGSVTARGNRDEDPVNGTGYVELTGYGTPFGPIGTGGQ